MEWHNLPRHAKNIFANITPTHENNDDETPRSRPERIRRSATVGLLAAAVTGLVVQSAYASEQPSSAPDETANPVLNTALVREESPFDISRPIEPTASKGGSQALASASALSGLQGAAARDGQAKQDTGTGSGQKQQTDDAGNERSKPDGAKNGKADQGNGNKAKDGKAGKDGKAKAEKKGNGNGKGKPEKAPAVDRIDRWINQAADILRGHGVKLSDADKGAIRIVIEKESSGDPRAINLWDSNAAKGIPSKGLMQTIDPTFNAHKLPGHGEIYNPVDNIIAGVRYTLSRYGSFAEHPGLASMASGGDYQGY